MDTSALVSMVLATRKGLDMARNGFG